MTEISPFGNHQENGTHLIMCKDGRPEIQDKIIGHVRDSLGIEPFLSAKWGGALGVVKLGVEGVKIEYLNEVPKVIGAPKKFVLVNHMDCAGVSGEFGVGHMSGSEEEKHVEVLNKAAQILKEAFPEVDVVAHLLHHDYGIKEVALNVKFDENRSLEMVAV